MQSMNLSFKINHRRNELSGLTRLSLMELHGRKDNGEIRFFLVKCQDAKFVFLSSISNYISFFTLIRYISFHFLRYKIPNNYSKIY